MTLGRVTDVTTARPGGRRARGWLSSRGRIVVGTIVLLLLLDVGRSVYARVGYAKPTETYQPDPAVSAEIVWPPGSDVAAGAPLGLQVYAKHCVVCHGPDGRGNGPASPALIPHPTDFTKGQFKYKSTGLGEPPTDDDLRQVVSNGLNASAMPFWNDLLTSEEISAVVDYIKSLSPVFATRTPAPIAIPPPVPADAASIARGGELFTARGCAGCHGADGRAQTEFTDAAGHQVVARDLTAPWTFRGGAAPEQVFRRLTTGLAPSPMPSFADSTMPQERWDLVNYVGSLARVPAWEAGGKLAGPRQQADLLRRGNYLLRSEMCDLCHTYFSTTGVYRVNGFAHAGGMRVVVYPHGVFVVRNITSDPQTGIGQWTEAQIADAIRNGRAPDRILNILAMPWPYLHGLTEDDATAIARYLKTAPGVHHEVPAALHYGVIETIVAKIKRGIPNAPPEAVVYAAGDWGQTGSGPTRDLPQLVLVSAQGLVLAAGVVLFVLATPPGSRLPRRRRGWLMLGLGTFGIVLVGFGGWVLYNVPAISLIPPDQIVSRSPAGNAPRPDPATLGSPEQAALVEQGRAIFVAGSCLYCHSTNASGGIKMSWKPIGSLWSGNLTPDPATGTGAWTDAQLARAIRSGVSRDGRHLLLAAMPWDKFSNLDEEDVRAVIAYLRAIPAVVRQIPPARPPAANDCVDQTFYIRGNLELSEPLDPTPGCQD